MFISNAYAEAAPPVQSAGLMDFLPLIVLVAVFYFFILRPQQQARKKHEELLKNLKKGDEVTTVGGLIGKVKEIKEDRVTVESGTASVIVERSRIVKVGDHAAAPRGVVG